MARTHLSPLAQGSRAALDTKVSEHDDALDAVEIKTKYMLALINRIHMEVDFEGLLDLSPLAGDASQDDANERANAMKEAWNEHLGGVGTIYVDGEHKAEDTNVVSQADADDLTSCIALVNALLASVIAHGDESGVHFHDDTGTGGTGASITTDPPVTLAHCITDLNDLKIAMQTHMGAGSQ